MVFYFSKCVLCLSLFGIAVGFKCYSCDYNIDHKDEDWNQPECIDKPEMLGSIINCNESYYCVAQETFSTETKIVTQYYRSCLTTSIGNKCVNEWIKNGRQMVCRSSCQKDFCNSAKGGDRKEAVLNNHNNSPRLPAMHWLMCVINTLTVLFIVLKS